MGGFATDIGSGDGVLPSILGKPEAEYYRLRSAPPAPPIEGQILLTRLPHTRMIKVQTPDGDTHRLVFSKETKNILIREYGVSADKIDSVMDYLWSFYRMYVTVDPVD